MAVYKRDMVDINLETGNIHRSFLKHSIGYKDAAADHFGIRVFRNGEPVSLTGVSVQGIFMPPQGSPIAITSGNIVSENEAEVILPQACYNYDGQFTLSIKLVDATNAVTGTMRIVDGMVDNTHASGTVAPTDTVPTYQEILAVYAQLLEDVTDYESVVATQDAKIDDLKSALEQKETDINNEITNLIDIDTLEIGFYKTDGTINPSNGFLHGLYACEANDVIYTNIIPGQFYTVAYFNSSKTFISYENKAPTLENNKFTIKNDANIAYFSYPIPYSDVGFSILTKTPFTVYDIKTGVGQKTQNDPDMYIQTKEALKYSVPSIVSTTYTVSNRNGMLRCLYNPSTTLADYWYYISINSTKAVVSAPYFHYMLAYNDSYAIGASFATSGKIKIRKLSLTTANWTDLFDYDYQTGRNALYYNYYIELSENGTVLIINTKTGERITFSIKNYIDSSYKMSIGFVHTRAYPSNRSMYVFDNFERTEKQFKNDSADPSSSHWQGKKWFAYGTSLTTEENGHWVNITASVLGLSANNKGIGGGALVANRNVYNAIMADDGKEDADIITFEFGANDRPSPLGTIDSTDNTTILGAANVCIQHLLETCPKAQIVIMPSLPNRYEYNHPEDEFGLNYEASGGWTRDDLYEGIRKLAQLNCVHFAPFGCEFGIPYYRAHKKNNGSFDNTYIADQIHPTALGGYNIAQAMIQYIGRIPLWYTSIPN